MRILITSAGTATSVNLIRYFHKMKDYVVSADINQYGYTAGSMMSDKYYQVALAADERYIQQILDIIKEEGIDVFIPVNDIEVYKVAVNIDKIPCKCLIPDSSTIELLRDKWICSNKMQELGIPVPEILTKQDVVKRILRDRIGVGSKGIRILTESEGTPAYNTEEKFVQKFIQGEEYTIDVLSDCSGQPLYVVPRKRIEVKSGVATKVKIERNEKLIGYVKEILRHVTLPGFSNIQFIQDDKGECWFVEVNYRFAGCGAATLAVCEDYLLQFKRILSGAKVQEPLNKDVRWGAIVTRYYEEIVYEDSIC